MFKKTGSILASLALLGFASCSDENPWIGESGQGAIQLKVSTDGRVKDAIPVTRAESETLPNPPSVEDFCIKVEKTDGSFSREYPSLASFREEAGFPTGNYTITALYGNMEEMGFDNPCYSGSTQVTVLEGRTAEAEVTATVANSLISIAYTEAFKNYLHDYSAGIHTDGHGYLDIPGDEERPAYVVPGNVSISVGFTNPQGKSVTVQPASFNAEAAHHYHITMNVDGGMGTPQLQVKFDDGVEEEDVVIDLTDELFSSPAPTVSAVGFDPEEEVEFLSGEAPDARYRFNVISHGGLNEVNLTISSPTYVPPFGKEINLVGAPAQLQQQLESLGIDAKGLFNNTDRMAIVDFSALPKNLPSGTYEVSLQAKDNYTRVSEPVTFRFTSVAPTVEAKGLVALAGLNEGTISVTYNGSHPETDILFKAQNRYGAWVEAKVIDCVEAQKTRAITSNTYTFTVKLPDTDQRPVKVKVYLYDYDHEKQTVDLDVQQPDYKLKTDGFANRVWVKVEASANQLTAISGALNFFINGERVADDRIERDSDSGDIIINGLQPGQAYVLTAGFSAKPESDAAQYAFNTEGLDNVPNGQFENNTKTIDINPINVGGIFKIGFGNSALTKSSSQAKSSIVRETPDDWANLNQLTCYTGSANPNTWYMVPSTWSEGGQVVIRTVGYHHNGEAIPASENGVTTRYYCMNVPSVFMKSPGELFLGTYSFGTGGASRGNGIDWATRPSYLTFDYKYEPKNDEQAEVYVAVLGEGDVVLAKNTIYLSSQSSMTTYTVKLDGYTFGSKARKLQLSFKSTRSGLDPYIEIPTGSDLSESELNSLNYISNPTISANNYHSLATGSKLTIDNVSLGYDDKAPAAAKSHKKTKSSKRR